MLLAGNTYKGGYVVGYTNAYFINRTRQTVRHVHINSISHIGRYSNSLIIRDQRELHNVNM